MQTDVVTGAFGLSGAAITRELRAAGHEVRTLTGHPGRGSSGDDRIDVRPLDFTDPEGLERDLRGAHTLYRCFWVRFPHGDATHAAAVANSRALFAAAARAGIERIVHVSITHADPASPYPYFSGKAAVEAHLRARPASGTRSPGPRSCSAGTASCSTTSRGCCDGCRCLPSAVGATTACAPFTSTTFAVSVSRSVSGTDDVTVDAVEPGSHDLPGDGAGDPGGSEQPALVVPAPGWAIPPLSAALGAVLHDVLLTREEYQAMAGGLADSDRQATSSTSLFRWSPCAARSSAATTPTSSRATIA